MCLIRHNMPNYGVNSYHSIYSFGFSFARPPELMRFMKHACRLFRSMSRCWLLLGSPWDRPSPCDMASPSSSFVSGNFFTHGRLCDRMAIFFFSLIGAFRCTSPLGVPLIAVAPELHRSMCLSGSFGFRAGMGCESSLLVLPILRAFGLFRIDACFSACSCCLAVSPFFAQPL